MSGRQVRVVAAVVRDGDRVLAARRAPDMARGGLWEFPGGKVEGSEDDAAALVREIDEELGAAVVVGPWLGEAHHAYDDITIVLVAYGCTRTAGAFEAREHDALRWVSAAELDGLAWAPADVPLLEPVRAWLASGQVVEGS